MDLKSCMFFLYTARLGSMSQAAEVLHISQPAISRHIRALEEELGVTLFTRAGKHISLSSQGASLVPYVEDVIDAMQVLHEAADHSQRGENPVLRIAAYDTYCSNDLQPIIRKFSNVHAQVSLRVFSRNSQDVIAGIVGREFDIGVVSGNMEEGSTVCREVIRSDPIVIVASAKCVHDHTKAQLMNELPVIRYLAKNSYAEMMDDCLRKSGIRNRQEICFSGLDSVKSALLHHIGITALSTDLIREELRQGELVPLDYGSPPMSVSSTMVFLREKQNDELVASFLQLAKNEMNM